MSKRRSSPRAMGAVLAGAALLAIAGYAALLVHSHPPRADFAGLVEAQGRPLPADAFRGQYKLVAFGYTRCPEACPTTLAKMHLVLEALGSGVGGLVPLFVTVDPEHDSPSELARYVEHFDPRIRGITGTPAALARYAAAYGARPAEGLHTPDGEPVHVVGLYLLGPSNELVASYDLGLATLRIAGDIDRRRGGRPGPVNG